MPSMQSWGDQFPGGAQQVSPGGGDPAPGSRPGLAHARHPAPPPAACTWDGIRGQLARGQHDVPEVEGGIVDGAELGAGAGGQGVAQRGADPADGGEVPPGEHVHEGVFRLHLRLLWGRQRAGLQGGRMQPRAGWGAHPSSPARLPGERPCGGLLLSRGRWRKAPQAPSRQTFITRSPCSTFCSSAEPESILGTGDVRSRFDTRMHLWAAGPVREGRAGGAGWGRAVGAGGAGVHSPTAALTGCGARRAPCGGS